MRYELTKYAGKKQSIILKELHYQGIIIQDAETGLWQRNGLTCSFAKELLLKTDKPLQQKIKELEALATRLEADAKKINHVLNGTTKHNLILLKNIYEEVHKKPCKN